MLEYIQGETISLNSDEFRIHTNEDTTYRYYLSSPRAEYMVPTTIDDEGRAIGLQQTMILKPDLYRLFLIETKNEVEIRRRYLCVCAILPVSEVPDNTSDPTYSLVGDLGSEISFSIKLGRGLDSTGDIAGAVDVSQSTFEFKIKVPNGTDILFPIEHADSVGTLDIEFSTSGLGLREGVYLCEIWAYGTQHDPLLVTSLNLTLSRSASNLYETLWSE